MPTSVRIQGIEVTLEPAEGVFTPSPYGLAYAESVTIRPGEAVLDVGTGTGVLAILAARLGAHAYATDVDPRAVAAAERNARLNGVAVECRAGALFAGFDRAFDVILANLPNEIVAPAHLARLAADEARTFDGGAMGSEVILALLEEARRHMHERSRLYLPVYSLTDYHGVLRAALRHYTVRLVGFTSLPVKPFVAANLDYYQALDDAGVVHLFRRDGRWHAYDYVYELGLR